MVPPKLPCVLRAYYDRGAPLFFLILPLNSGSLRPLPKTDLEKNITATG